MALKIPYFFFCLLFALLSSGAASAQEIIPAQSQTPAVVVTWQAQNYAPSTYRGKVLPAPGSTVVAMVEIIEKGKIANLSQELINWYLDGEFLQGGVGLQEVVFKIGSYVGTSAQLRVRIPNYGEDLAIRTIELPIVRPQVVVEAPFPTGNFTTSELSLKASPYFFNVESPSELTYEWSVNGEKPAGAENPDRLQISFPGGLSDGQYVTIEARADDPRERFSSANSTLNLTYRAL
jgi:hypothetical protein